MSILSVYFVAFLLLLSGVYYLVPNKIKPLVILVGNVYFYLQFGVWQSLFLLFSIVSVFFGARILEKASKVKIKKLILGAVLFLNIGFLFYVKFTPYILSNLQKIFTFDSTGILKTVIVPLGVAFYTLQICGYLIDVYKEKYAAEKNFLKREKEQRNIYWVKRIM